MIKAVIFDLEGGYFFDGKQNFINSLSKEFNLNAELVQFYYLSSDKMTKYKRGEISGNEFWSYFTYSLDINPPLEKIFEILKSSYKINEHIKNLAVNLKEKGIQTVVCSNNFLERVQILDEAFAFKKDFNHLIFSFEEHCLKLEGFRMYDQVVIKTGLSKDEILIFDNGEANIAHAKDYGFQTILYSNHYKLLKELEFLKVL